jgi:hypothetical protein
MNGFGFTLFNFITICAIHSYTSAWGSPALLSIPKIFDELTGQRVSGSAGKGGSSFLPLQIN